MRAAGTLLGLLVSSTFGVAGCLGPDLGFAGGEGGAGGAPATDAATTDAATTDTTTSPSATTTAVTSAGGDGGSGPASTSATTSGSGGAGGGPECVQPESCPDPGDACLVRTCEGGTCGTLARPDGFLLPNQTAGDCRVLTCEGGTTVASNDDGDLPEDFNDCTIDDCVAGSPSNDPASIDAPCGVGGELFCDGAGLCVGCTDAGQCAGTDDDCKSRTCDGGVCDVDFVPSGLPANQVDGNCAEEVCDGAGNVTLDVDDLDVPVDGNDCTDDQCNAGIASNPNLETGLACGAGPSCTELPATAKAQDVCDGFGTCDAQPAEPCVVADQCLVPICSGDFCGAELAAEDTPCDFSGPLDGVCDAGGACVQCNGNAQCAMDETCANGLCVGAAEKIVFITSAPVFPNFNGTTGGDAACQTFAAGAGLTGTFRAWLSDGSSSPAATFVQSAVPYRLVDGTTVANDWNDLIDGTLSAGISVDENGGSIPGSEVWTGTNAFGDGNADDCSGWTTMSGQSTGFVGLSGTTGSWSTVYSQFCDRDNVRLYCFEQ